MTINDSGLIRYGTLRCKVSAWYSLNKLKPIYCLAICSIITFCRVACDFPPVSLRSGWKFPQVLYSDVLILLIGSLFIDEASAKNIVPYTGNPPLSCFCRVVNTQFHRFFPAGQRCIGWVVAGGI